MLKFFAVILLVILVQPVLLSQNMIHQDSYNLDGGILFSASNSDHPDYNSKTISIIFNPSFAYHLLDVFSLGGNISYKYSEETIIHANENFKAITRVFEFGPKVRYYFHTENFAPFVNLSFNYSVVLPAKTKGYGFAIGTGINYFFTKSAALEPQVSYVISKYSNPDYNSRTFQLGIGLTYHISD
ncbi:MAG: outer membrane beta-barrel protein [bacterium]